MSAKKAARKVTIRQIRSGIGRDKSQKATLRALGLGRPGHAREIADTPEVRAMVASVPHLVRIEKGKE